MDIVSYNTVRGKSNPAFIAILAASREGGSSTRTTHNFFVALCFSHPLLATRIIARVLWDVQDMVRTTITYKHIIVFVLAIRQCEG